MLVSTPLPSAPALDVVRSYATWNATAKTITLHVGVKDISQQPPTGSTGEAVDYAFGVGGKGYFDSSVRTTSSRVTALTSESPIQTTVSDRVNFAVDTKAQRVHLDHARGRAVEDLGRQRKRGPVLGAWRRL